MTDRAEMERRTKDFALRVIHFVATLPPTQVGNVITYQLVKSMVQANLGALLQTRAELSAYRWPAYPLQDALRRQAPVSLPAVDLAPAIARYRAALALDLTNAAANRRLGQIELSQGDYVAAQAHLEAAYRTAPGQQATRQLLGESYAIAGRTAALSVNSAEGCRRWETRRFSRSADYGKM
jgi:predicted Zn-dependent protease